LTFGGDTAITERSVMLVLPAGSGNKFALTFCRCAVLASGACFVSEKKTRLSWRTREIGFRLDSRRLSGRRGRLALRAA